LDRFTNILKQRLEDAQSTPTAHPSTDTLAAFIERGLTSSQRESVLTHLSVCPDCRETVAFATPEIATANAQAANFSFSRALKLPATMRWASLAAALAVAIGVGVIAYEQEPRQQLATFSAPLEKASAPVSTTAVQANQETKSNRLQSAVGRSEAPTSTNKPAKPVVAEERRERALAKKQTESSGVISAMAVAPPPVAESKEKEKDAHAYNTKALPSAPQPALADKRDTDSLTATTPASPQVRAAAVTSDNKTSQDRNPTKVPESESFNDRAIVGGLAGSALAEAQPSPKAMNAVSVGSTAKARRAYGMLAFVHWTISAAGKLQRRAIDGTLTIVEPVPGAIIRAVAAEGIEVWAGGSRTPPSAKNMQPRSLLFHSSDAGETWKTVDGPWQGSITRVNLAGLNSLTVVTSDGSWSTGDAGKSWSKP